MLSIGAAHCPLPMPVGQPLAGYASRAGSATGIHDDLWARACVVSAGADTLCVLAVDLLCVDAEFVAEVRQAIAAASAIRPEAILIAATHTHSGPAGVARFRLDRSAELYLGARHPVLRVQAHEALVAAARQAAASALPARLLAGTGQVEAVARNRINPDGPYDPEVPFVLALDPQGRVVAAIFSLASHSTVLGADNLAYSGDLIGAVCRQLETHWGGQSVVLGLAGAAGDISTRFTRQEATFAEVERLAAQVVEAITQARPAPAEDQPLQAAQATLQLALSPAESAEVLHARLADARRRFDALPANAGAGRRLIEVEIEGLQIALESGQHRPAHVQAEVQVLRIGSVLLAGFPGEMFVEFGLQTRAVLRPKHVLIAGYANDYIGYVPTPGIRGGYEATMAVVAPDSGLRLVAAIRRLAGDQGP